MTSQHSGAVQGGGFNPNNPVRVSGRKYEFDLKSKDWVSTPTTINITRPAGYFDAGGMRVCFFVQEVEDDGCTMDCVAKFFKVDIPDVVHADYLNEAMAQCLSEEFAQNFNKMETPKKISFLNCSVIVVEERDTPPLHLMPQNNFFTFRTQDTKRVAFCMEPKLNGEFTKYNSNFGDCYANNKRDAKKGVPMKTGLDSVFVSAEAFSHFTLQESGGSFLVCDLQGVEDLLTDPQIHTEEGKGLGMGNMGQEGIDKWWSSHKCNAVCHQLGLKPYSEILNPRPPQHVIDQAQGPPPASSSQSSGDAGAVPAANGPPLPLPYSATNGSTPPPPSGPALAKPPGPQATPNPNHVPPPPGTWGSLYSNESQPSQVQPPPQHPQGAPHVESSRSKYHDIRNSMYTSLPDGVQPSMRPSQRHLFQGRPGQQQSGQSGAIGPGIIQPQPNVGQAFPGHHTTQQQLPPAGAPGSFLPPPGPASPYGQNQAGQAQGNVGYAAPLVSQYQQPAQLPGQQQQQPMLYGGPTSGSPNQLPQAGAGFQQQQQQSPHQAPGQGFPGHQSPVTQQPPIAQQPPVAQQPPAQPLIQQGSRDLHQLSEEEQFNLMIERSKLDR